MLDAAEVAKRTRADIKAALKAGTLPPHPGEVRIRCRCERFAGGSSVDVFVDEVPEGWLLVHGGRHVSEDARALGAALSQIAQKHRESNGRTFFVMVYANGGLIIG